MIDALEDAGVAAAVLLQAACYSLAGLVKKKSQMAFFSPGISSILGSCTGHMIKVSCSTSSHYSFRL